MSRELRAASLVSQNEKKYSFSIVAFEISPNEKSNFSTNKQAHSSWLIARSFGGSAE
jgi:hypothetical protein